MALSEWQVFVEREGLLFHISLVDSNKLIGTINLKEELGLSDEQAEQMLARLDENDRNLAEVL